MILVSTPPKQSITVLPFIGKGLQ